MTEIVRAKGIEGLRRLPGIGETLARAIYQTVISGRMPIIALATDTAARCFFPPLIDYCGNLATYDERSDLELGVACPFAHLDDRGHLRSRKERGEGREGD